MKKTINHYCALNKIKDFPVKIKDINTSVANICGVNRTTVSRALKKSELNLENCENITGAAGRPKIICDSFTISSIRQVCCQFYANKEYPTANKIRLKCFENDHFPRVSLAVFKKWLIHNCKFKYRKINKKPVYLERTDVLAQRDHYLRNVRYYRQLGYKIYFQDETWTSPNQSRNRCWQVLLDNTGIQEFKRELNRKVLMDVNGWAGGFIVKGGQGRIIVNHIGGEDGFLDGAEDVFISKKDSSDYHGSMNAEHFNEWFRNVLTIIPDKSVIVLDMAPYHRKRVPGTIMPKMSWLKSKIVEWFLHHHIILPENVDSFYDLTKASLIQLSLAYPVKEEYYVDHLVRDCGKDVKLLFLPVGHCELNPIELIWAYMKGKVSEKNTTGGTKNVLGLTKDCIKLVTKELWQNCIREAIKFENKFWERDRLIERNMGEILPNPDLIISLNAEDSSEFESSESECESEAD